MRPTAKESCLEIGSDNSSLGVLLEDFVVWLLGLMLFLICGV
jgi:hypothetical protein